MVARILTTILALELGVYLLGGLWLSYRLGCSPLWALPIALAAAIVVRVAQIAVTFTVAILYREQAPDGARLTARARLKLFLAELAAFVAMFTVLQPLRAWLMKPPEIGNSRGVPPVVLVHGFFCNAAEWWWFRRRLQRSLAGPVFAIDLEPPLAGIDELAAQLSRHVERICEATGAARVVLVAHSMGGLVARAYLQDPGGVSRVARLVTLGSPHHGTALAYLAVGRNARQMRPGNDWLARLNARENEPAPAPIVAFFTRHDNFVAPQGSARLANATNVALTGVGHLSLVFSRDVARRVREEIARANQK